MTTSKFTDRDTADILRLMTLAVNPGSGKKLYEPITGMCDALHNAYLRNSLSESEYLRCRRDVVYFVKDVSSMILYLNQAVDDETCMKIYRDWDNRYNYVSSPSSYSEEDGWPVEFK